MFQSETKPLCDVVQFSITTQTYTSRCLQASILYFKVSCSFPEILWVAVTQSLWLHVQTDTTARWMASRPYLDMDQTSGSGSVLTTEDSLPCRHLQWATPAVYPCLNRNLPWSSGLSTDCTALQSLFQICNLHALLQWTVVFCGIRHYRHIELFVQVVLVFSFPLTYIT